MAPKSKKKAASSPSPSTSTPSQVAFLEKYASMETVEAALESVEEVEGDDSDELDYVRTSII